MQEIYCRHSSLWLRYHAEVIVELFVFYTALTTFLIAEVSSQSHCARHTSYIFVRRASPVLVATLLRWSWCDSDTCKEDSMFLFGSVQINKD